MHPGDDAYPGRRRVPPRWQLTQLGYCAPMTRSVRAPRDSFLQGQVVVVPTVLAGLTVAVASLLVGGKRGDVRVDVALASMAAFLFGVLLAFTIVRTRERLALVHNLVATGNSSLLSIHQMVAVFDDIDRRHIRQLIDDHLTDQIDYRLVDYYRAVASYLRLADALYALRPVTPQEEAVYKDVVQLGINMTVDRALIEAATGQAMSAIEWTGLLLLLALLLALIAVLPGGTILGAVVAGALAGALVTLMVLLRRLDLLRWHERVTIWEPTTRLFRSMGQHPYVPRHVITTGRYRPTGLVRVVDYPDPYPIRSTKTVRVEDLGPATDADVTEVQTRGVRALSTASLEPGMLAPGMQPVGAVEPATRVAMTPTVITVGGERGTQHPGALEVAGGGAGSATAGWYVDPAGAAHHRYWNGEAWTTHVR